MKRPRLIRIPALLVVLAMAAGCANAGSDPAEATIPATVPSTTAPAPATTATDATDDHDDDHEDPDDHGGQVRVGAEEVDDPMPRLVVADATGAVAVIDLTTGEEVTTLAIDADPLLLAPVDGRLLLAVHYDNDVVTVIDGGAWSDPHGDHFHHYITEPTVFGAVEGPQPAHMVTHAGLVAMFFDGLGEARIFEVDELVDGDLHVEAVVDTSSPHHGVVVPADGDHYLVSIPADDPDELPIGIEVRHGVEEVEAEFPDCGDMHGELGTHTAFAFACDDGILIVTGDDGAGWTAETAAYPEGLGARVWLLAGGHHLDWAVGALSQAGPPYGPEAGVLVVDLASATATAHETPAPAILAVADAVHAAVLVLTADGTLHQLDVVSGEIMSTRNVVSAIDPEAELPRPSISVSGTRVYLTDPAATTVSEIALNDDLRIARVLELDLVPVDVAVVGG